MLNNLRNNNLDTTTASKQEEFPDMTVEFLVCLLILGCVAVKLRGWAPLGNTVCTALQEAQSPGPRPQSAGFWWEANSLKHPPLPPGSDRRSRTLCHPTGSLTWRRQQLQVWTTAGAEAGNGQRERPGPRTHHALLIQGRGSPEHPWARGGFSAHPPQRRVGPTALWVPPPPEQHVTSILVSDWSTWGREAEVSGDLWKPVRERVGYLATGLLWGKGNS